MYGQEVQSHALVAVESSVYHAVVVEADVEDVACSWWLGSSIMICCRLAVCLSSSYVTRVYCDKTTEVRITRFSHKSSVYKVLAFSKQGKVDGEIRMGSPWSGGSNYGGVVFDFTVL